MRRSFPKLMALFLIVGSFGAASRRESEEKTQREVLATDDMRIQARTQGDLETMSRIYGDDYQLVTAEGVLRTKEDQINEMQSGQLQFQPVENLARSVRLYDNTAIVLSHERSTIIRNGQDIGGNFRMNRVYIRRDERWQLVLAHATRIIS